MKLTFSPNPLDKAPADYVRVRLTKESRGVRRFVREGSTEWIELGVGKEINNRQFVILCRAIVNTAKTHTVRKLAVQFEDTPALASYLASRNSEQLYETIAVHFEMANFEFRTFKTKPKEGWNELAEIRICDAATPARRTSLTRGQTIGRAVNACRELANTPAGDITPRKLAQAAKAAVKGLPVTVTILGRTQIETLGMGLLAGVGAGSSHEPTFTVMEYKGAKGAPVVIAGKGITFDSGGLNLKPSSGIYEMHMDMSGGAAVIHAVALAAKLKVKKHVIGLIPAAENMLGTNAMRPGDILTSLSGKTVEVTDTDAEGRLVLADAITYAKRFAPGVVLDVATLTGAALIALGHHASGLMTRDEALAETLLSLSETSGDYLWRLPMWDEYESVVKSEFADMQNHSISQGRYGGATNGAMFLWQFAKDLECSFAHIDIAPRMTAATGEELVKGAAGAPVRLLLSFIESWKG